MKTVLVNILTNLGVWSYSKPGGCNLLHLHWKNNPRLDYIIENMNHPDNQIKHDQYLDAKGLNCPLPVLKAKVALNKMAPGEILLVHATDPHATIDFEAYCARIGHIIINSEVKNNIISIYIKRTEIHSTD
jgi:tRNA 2-thiouridine synthesizing protein A